MERALNGVEVPHYHKGELVGTSRRFDERLTVSLLGMRGNFLRPPAPMRHPSSAYEPDDSRGLVERVESRAGTVGRETVNSRAGCQLWFSLKNGGNLRLSGLFQSLHPVAFVNFGDHRLRTNSARSTSPLMPSNLQSISCGSPPILSLTRTVTRCRHCWGVMHA